MTCPQENIDLIGRSELLEFLKQYHHPDRIVVAAVGVDHAELVSAVDKWGRGLGWCVMMQKVHPLSNSHGLGNLPTVSGSNGPGGGGGGRHELQLRLIFFRARSISLIHYFLLAFFVPLLYFILAISMPQCLGTHSCMSPTFKIFLLNGTCLFREMSWSLPRLKIRLLKTY